LICGSRAHINRTVPSARPEGEAVTKVAAKSVITTGEALKPITMGEGGSIPG
jgi:hypothetical protein